MARNITKKHRNKSDLGSDLIAPDGGWGWLVCVAAGLSNFVSFPVLQQFGLIYYDRLLGMGMPNAEITTLINTQLSLNCCVGLFNGPMFRRFSYRQVAVLGATMTAGGLLLLSVANSFWTYYISFSVLYGIGTGFNKAANSLALNTYFKEKRRTATGFSTTITAFGPIIFPYIFTVLLAFFGVQGTVLLFSGLALNGVAFALFYQPVRWHTKRVHNDTVPLDNANNSDNKLPLKPEESQTICEKVVQFFDLDLLKDVSYLNLMIGLNIALCAELNYSILTPFVLADYEFSKTEIATVMSVLGAMDTIVRFSIPFVADKIGWQNKTFFMVGVMGMAFGRIAIAHFRTFWPVMIASCWIGLNKGIRTVFTELVIPTYVPLSRLPAAAGLQLLFGGLFFMILGPVVGWIRDTTNYTVTLHCLNLAAYLTCISWTAEKYYRRYRRTKDSNNESGI